MARLGSRMADLHALVGNLFIAERDEEDVQLLLWTAPLKMERDEIALGTDRLGPVE